MKWEWAFRYLFTGATNSPAFRISASINVCSGRFIVLYDKLFYVAAYFLKANELS